MFDIYIDNNVVTFIGDWSLVARIADISRRLIHYGVI